MYSPETSFCLEINLKILYEIDALNAVIFWYFDIVVIER